jgi:uncharacterized membrane protein
MLMLIAGPDTTALAQMALRWIHLVAGITWIGLLYYFNLVQAPFLQEIEPGIRAKVVPPLMKRALFWFRWSALVTVLAGLTYWMTILASDLRNARAEGSYGTPSGLMAAGSFFWLWTAAWGITYLAVCIARLEKMWVVGVVYLAAVWGASHFYIALNDHGWESSRLLAIGVGGGMGWMMLLNVWGVIWRHQKKLIRWTEAATAQGAPMPAEAAGLTRQALVTSRANLVLSFPMLFFMGAASHLPLLGR